jgi:hypothetical protein
MAEHLTGLHAVEEAIRAGRRGTLYVEKRNKRTSVIMERAAAGGIEVVSCRPGGIVKRTGLSTETGISSLSGERAPARDPLQMLDFARHLQTSLPRRNTDRRIRAILRSRTIRRGPGSAERRSEGDRAVAGFPELAIRGNGWYRTCARYSEQRKGIWIFG